jgi:hypothetical protein
MSPVPLFFGFIGFCLAAFAEVAVFVGICVLFGIRTSAFDKDDTRLVTYMMMPVAFLAFFWFARNHVRVSRGVGRFCGSLQISRLSSPVQRMFLLVFLGGVATTIATAILLHINSYWGFFDAILYSRGAYVTYRVTFYCGLVVALIGFIFSFYYKNTLGRLIQWIRYGSKRDRSPATRNSNPTRDA